MGRVAFLAAVTSLLMLLTAFVVPVAAPVRASSLHLLVAIAVLCVGGVVTAAVLFVGRDRPLPDVTDGQSTGAE